MASLTNPLLQKLLSFGQLPEEDQAFVNSLVINAKDIGADIDVPHCRNDPHPRAGRLSSERRHYFDEVMTFRPAFSLAAYRPLGSVMRARLQVYAALSAFRHRENGIDAKSVFDIAAIPA